MWVLAGDGDAADKYTAPSILVARVASALLSMQESGSRSACVVYMACSNLHTTLLFKLLHAITSHATYQAR
jgi:hypothetical protein